MYFRMKMDGGKNWSMKKYSRSLFSMQNTECMQISNVSLFLLKNRMDIKLESLEDAVILEDDGDDLLSDKHGCPAYVSPEILKCNTRYSGRAADMWGLGVMLYTMLVGR